MLPSVWRTIKRYLLEETKEKRLDIYYDNDVIVPTIKRLVFVTPVKRIQLTTAERQMEEHQKLDRMITYTRKHITLLQCVFGISFRIGTRVQHQKPKSDDERQTRKPASTTSKNPLALIPDATAMGATSVQPTPVPCHTYISAGVFTNNNKHIYQGLYGSCHA
jgi:hypothetical protein